MPDVTAFLEKTVLFEARTHGYHNYRIPGIVVSPGGVVLATVEARRGRGGDWDANDIMLRRSLDNGQTWEPAQMIVTHDQHGEGLISNFVMINDPEKGLVHGVYCHSYQRAFYIASSDDGATFSEPVDITPAFDDFRTEYDWKVIATGPGHGLRLSNGRLIIPVWLSTGEGRGGHRPSIVSLIYSDEAGQTWKRGEIFILTDEQFLNPSETVAVELSDGRVLMNIRSESDPFRRLISTSPNGINQWTTPQYDEALLEPQCMASLLKLEHSEQTPSPIIFANPDNLERELPGVWERAHDRKRLAVKLSEDDCAIWSVSKVLEEGPAGYSDLAQAADGTIFCLYECGMMEKMADTRSITVAHFNLDWLRA